MIAVFNNYRQNKRGSFSLSGLGQFFTLYFSIISITLIFSFLFSSLFNPLRSLDKNGEGTAWFNSIKGNCDAVRVEAAILNNPPENTIAGHGYAATCYCLAGKIEKAREWINKLPQVERSNAASVVFHVAHPIADRGDDASSGPMMELTLEYQPNNYMALYHAGMSEYIAGDYPNSMKNLRRFLELYNTGDSFTKRGQIVLSAMEKGEKLSIETVRGFTLE